jgi:uncharacterized protein (DUF305 family)
MHYRLTPVLALLAAALCGTIALGGLAGAAPRTRPTPTPSPKPTPTPNPTVAALARLAGRDLDVAAARELLARFEEEIEIAYAATLNADHPPLLQWNQKMIERKSAQVKTLLGLLAEASAAPGRRGVGVVTPEVKQIRQLKGGSLERRYLPLMIDRFETNVAIADMAARKGAGPGLKTLVSDIAKIERQETVMLRAWLKEWYGR